jgi:hypothetical protein
MMLDLDDVVADDFVLVIVLSVVDVHGLQVFYIFFPPATSHLQNSFA